MKLLAGLFYLAILGQASLSLALNHVEHTEDFRAIKSRAVVSVGSNFIELDTRYAPEDLAVGHVIAGSAKTRSKASAASHHNGHFLRRITALEKESGRHTLRATTTEASIVDAIADAHVSHSVLIETGDRSTVQRHRAHSKKHKKGHLRRHSGKDGDKLCSNTCKYKSDGECDDGGFDSITSVCAIGTDCDDCKPRSSSTRQTRICDNSCKYAKDGECDDGGPGAQYKDCALGSDCVDCGGRVLTDDTGASGNVTNDDQEIGANTNIDDRDVHQIKASSGPEIYLDNSASVSFEGPNPNYDNNALRRKWHYNADLYKAEVFAELKAEISLGITLGGLDHFRIEFRGTAVRDFKARITWDCDGDLFCEHHDSTVLNTVTLPDLTLRLGNLELKLTPVLKTQLNSQVSFTKSGFVDFNYGRKFHIMAGVEYKDGDWSPLFKPPTTEIIEASPQLVSPQESDWNSQLSTEVSLHLMYRGVIGPSLYFDPIGSIAMNAGQVTQRYTESVSAGATLDFLGFSKAYKSDTLFTINDDEQQYDSYSLRSESTEVDFWVLGLELDGTVGQDPGESMFEGMRRVAIKGLPDNDPTSGWQEKHRQLNAWLDALSDEQWSTYIEQYGLTEECYDLGDNWDRVYRDCTKKDQRQWLWNYLYHKTRIWGYEPPKRYTGDPTEPIGWKVKLVCQWEGYQWQAKDATEAGRRFRSTFSNFDSAGGGARTNYGYLCTGVFNAEEDQRNEQ